MKCRIIQTISWCNVKAAKTGNGYFLVQREKRFLISFFPSHELFDVCRYHPACVGMTIEEAKKLDHFVCAECSSDDDVKKSQNGFSASPADDVVKVSLFRIYKLHLSVQKLEADIKQWHCCLQVETKRRKR